MGFKYTKDIFAAAARRQTHYRCSSSSGNLSDGYKWRSPPLGRLCSAPRNPLAAGPDHPWGWWGWSLRARAPIWARTARYNENLQSRTTLGPKFLERKKVTVTRELRSVLSVCTRGPQSLSCLRARRDHDPALLSWVWRPRQNWKGGNGRKEEKKQRKKRDGSDSRKHSVK